MNHFKCCICGKVFWGYGNNPAPVKDKGRCCDICNSTQVIPTRLGIISSNQDDEQGESDE